MLMFIFVLKKSANGSVSKWSKEGDSRSSALCFAGSNPVATKWFRSVMVITVDFESTNPVRIGAEPFIF
jgi:hypothetical protein